MSNTYPGIVPNDDSRAMLFIDGANLHATQKALGWEIDFAKLLNVFRKKGSLNRAYYFTAVHEDGEENTLAPMLDYLSFNGYTLVTKPVKTFYSPDHVVTYKGNMDVEIAIYMLQYVDNYDHAYLFSGDGDFRAAVEAIQSKGKIVTVVSALDIRRSKIADELRRQTDFFVDLKYCKDQLERNGKRN